VAANKPDRPDPGFGAISISLKSQPDPAPTRPDRAPRRPGETYNAVLVTEPGQQRFGDLHRVERRPLPEVVAGQEQDQPVRRRRVPADPSDQRGVDAGAGQRGGDVDELHTGGAGEQGQLGNGYTGTPYIPTNAVYTFP